MARPKGIPKTGGRKPGTVNKSTDELRNLLQSFIDTNMKTMQADYDKLEPKDRLTFINNLLRHVLPAPLQVLERLTDEQLDELIERLKKNNP
jgi:polyhydroxyalkanoate synthesis regulator protein